MDFSLQCSWLLDAYIGDQMKISKKPNDAVRLLFDILYEKYKSKICYTPTMPTNYHHFTLDEVENENIINNDDYDDDDDDDNNQNQNDMTSERILSQEHLMTQMNKKRGHQKSQSDLSGIILRSALSLDLKKYHL